MRNLLLLLILVLVQWSATAGQIELRGTYQGENLYVKNPFSATGVGFCVYEVTVNGMTSTDEINSTAFEIDLAVYGFSLGEPVVVSINYKEGCLPRVLNADVLNAKASFEIEEFKVQGDNVVWKTRNETGALPFIVEQFRWNKWIAVGQVDGFGVEGINSYSAPVRLHAGENRFRIRQTDSRKASKISTELVHSSSKEPVSFNVVSGNDLIEFSSATMYELYDSFGRIIVKGYGRFLKIDELEKGWYYLNYDNQLDMFKK
jgi:hypothetical protein